MTILAIETSCDETGLAFVEVEGGLRNPHIRVRKNLVASQVAVHRPFGGVVPNLAKREHQKNLPILFKKLFHVASRFLHSADAIAVTVGPGLEPALWQGIVFAKKLQKNWKAHGFSKKPALIGVNHLEAHLFSFLLVTSHTSQVIRPKVFPAVALIVSGGHTILLKVDSLTKWKKLGETQDDAVGEAFDKVARLLQLPYPGGPEIQKLARKGNPDAIAFPRPMIHLRNFNFSFSGLKTAVLYYLRDHPRAKKADVAASFEEAAVDVLVQKTMRAAKEYNAQSVLLSGGVAANQRLREVLKRTCRMAHLNFLVAPLRFNTDNAAMIAVAGYLQHLRKKRRALVARGDMTL